MTISELQKLPTGFQLERQPESAILLPRFQGFHQSFFQAYQLMIKVKELLELNTPQSVVLEIIKEVEQTGGDYLKIDLKGDIIK